MVKPHNLSTYVSRGADGRFWLHYDELGRNVRELSAQNFESLFRSAVALQDRLVEPTLPPFVVVCDFAGYVDIGELSLSVFRTAWSFSTMEKAQAVIKVLDQEIVDLEPVIDPIVGPHIFIHKAPERDFYLAEIAPPDDATESEVLDHFRYLANKLYRGAADVDGYWSRLIENVELYNQIDEAGIDDAKIEEFIEARLVIRGEGEALSAGEE